MLEIPNEHSDPSDSSFDKDKNSPKNVKLPKIERGLSKGKQKEVKSSTKLPGLKS